MQRHKPVAALLDAEHAPRGAFPGAIERCEQRVDHRVADKVDPRRVDAFALEVRIRALRMRQEQIADVVGEAAVVLLRHIRIEAAQPRFEVRDRNAELHGGERCRERGVDVTRHDDE